MSKSPSRRFPVTVTQLPVTRCQICHRTVAYRPGNPHRGPDRALPPGPSRSTRPRIPVAGRGDPRHYPQSSSPMSADPGRLPPGPSSEIGKRRHSAANPLVWPAQRAAGLYADTDLVRGQRCRADQAIWRRTLVLAPVTHGERHDAGRQRAGDPGFRRRAVVVVLDDLFGIQARGGCSCARLRRGQAPPGPGVTSATTSLPRG